MKGISVRSHPTPVQAFGMAGAVPEYVRRRPVCERPS
jgi:hypothetical protein